MRILHGRDRRRVSLLASGALSGPERGAALAHLAGCAACRTDYEALRAMLELVAADPLRGAEPPIPAGALLARIQARLDEAGPWRPVPRHAWRLALGLAGGAAAAAVAAAMLLRGGREEPQGIVVSEDALRRLERTVAREQAARYLSAAQDVLVTVAASPRNCPREAERVDVAEEARRSRELLARRALLVEMDRDEVAPARPVLEDVEQMLREVASLEACVRPGDVAAIQREIERRQLLMKIRLMTRELQG